MNKIYEFARKHPIATSALVGAAAVGSVAYVGVEFDKQDNEILTQNRVVAVKTIDQVDIKDTFILPSGTKIRYSPTDLPTGMNNDMTVVPSKQAWVVTNAFTSTKDYGCIAFNVPGVDTGEEQKSIETAAKKIGWVCGIDPIATDSTKKNVKAAFNTDGSIALGLPANAWKDFLGAGGVKIVQA